MKSKRTYADYLDDILDCAGKIIKFTEGMTYQQFQDDDKTIFAVVRAFEIIGEAAKHIPRSVRDKYPYTDWRGMTGMRDKLIHEYFGVNLQIIWEAIQNELPELNISVRKVLESVDKQQKLNML